MDDETRKGLQPLKDDLHSPSAELIRVRRDFKARNAEFVRRCDFVLDKLDAIIDDEFGKLEIIPLSARPTED